ncbi:MFS transporter [Kribbella jejuensis]|nr:MFS transporter [Kribbella jejuensis]
MALAVLCLAAMLVSMLEFVLLLAMPALTAALGASSTQQLWILDVYGFMVAGLMIAMGHFADRVGRRRLLLIAAAVFAVASVVAAYSVNAGMLIGARAVVGIAGASIAPCTLSLISMLFPDERRRVTALGLWAGCFALGAVAGPIVGGLLLAEFWWGSALLIGVPAMVALLVLGPLLLPEHRTERAGQVDVLSALLLPAAILPAVYGLKHFAAQGVHVMSVVGLVTGLVIGWTFVRRQRRLSEPLVDVRLFSRSTSGAMLAGMLVFSVLSGGVTVFVVQYFQLVQGMTPLAAGLAVVPGVLTSVVAFQLAPIAARRIRPGVLIPGGIACTTAGMVVMTQATSTTVLMFAFAVGCVGSAPVQMLGTNLVIGSVPPQKAGTAAAVAQTSLGIGLALGVAILGSVMTVSYRSISGRTAGTSLAEAIADAEPEVVLARARDAFTTGLHLIAGMSAVVLTIVGIMLVFALRRLPALGMHGSDDVRRRDRRSAS